MARTTIAPVQADSDGAVLLTETAADTVNFNQAVHTGKEIILARNTNVAAQTVTITSAPDALGRIGHITADSVGIGATKIYGPFPTHGWRQVDGFLYFQASNAQVLFTVIRLP